METASWRIAPNWIVFGSDRPDRKIPIDMTRERSVCIRHRRGLVEARVDGKALVYSCVFHGGLPLPDHYGGNPERSTQFGQFGDSGLSRWKSVSYTLMNPTLRDFSWTWEAASGQWPDQYQRDRLIQNTRQSPGPETNSRSRLLLLGDPRRRAHLIGRLYQLRRPAGKEPCRRGLSRNRGPSIARMSHRFLIFG